MRAATTATVAVLILALLLPPLLTGCGSGGGEVLRLLGRVLDAGSLQPVVGARVVVDSTEVATDTAGRFDIPSAPSSGTVTVTATGYQNTTTSIPAGTDEIDLGDIYLVPAPLPGTGNVTGLITQAGVLVEGAIVRAGGREARTRADGRYTLYNVPAGFQTVFAVSPDSSTGGSLNITVFSAMTVTANIQLTTQPPPPPT